ncbi:2-hydroxyacyl-CoA dehydratase family protein [archaeon]|nr:2-hydroxyacyl-CoA dehydratase family protein [archaeon]
MTTDIQSEYISMDLRGVREVLGMLATEFDRMKKAKKAGRPIVGTWLNSPNEILLAANTYATTFRFEGLHSDIIKGREDLRKAYEMFNMEQCFCLDVCRSLGSPVLGAPRDYDLVVTDFTAKAPEWEGIMKTYIDEKWNFMPLEIPRGLEKKEALTHIEERLNGLRAALEEMTGKEITDDELRDAFEKTNRVRDQVKKIDELIKTDPMPIRGGDVWFAYFPMSSCYIGGEVDKTHDLLEDLHSQIQERIESGFAAYDRDVKKICAIPSGSNVTKDVYPVMEKAGGVLVTDWPCCEHGGLLFRDRIKLVGDPIKNLAKHYLKTFGIFDEVQDAKDILEMVNRLSIDAVIYDKQLDLFGYKAPVASVSEVMKVLSEKGIPIHVHEGHDVSGIKAFIEAC